MQLAELKPGQIAKIISLEDSVYKEKLMEMGCIPGALIKTVLKAPMGDPIAYELDGYTLSMRKSEARNIHVKPIHTSSDKH